MAEPDAIVEGRGEPMVPLTGPQNPVFRLAHFIKPTFSPTSVDEPLPKLPTLSHSSPKTGSFKLKLKGWKKKRKPEWVKWVHHFREKRESEWRKAGIFEAIVSSTYEFRRQKDLLVCLAQKWCPETNTFLFPWGEATITLEDVMILAGYSVSGSPVFLSVQSERSIAEEMLMEARRTIQTVDPKVSQSSWIQAFMGSENLIEHEAFLAVWLSRFVLLDSSVSVEEKALPLAVSLARGVRISLAPIVLASIYRDLSLLKKMIDTSNKFKHGELELELFSQFHLVQLWAWERFPTLQAVPKFIHIDESRSARWDKAVVVEVKDVRFVMDGEGESFLWRPYATATDGWCLPGFYKEKEEWTVVDSESEEDLQSFSICLVPSVLPGLKDMQVYLPHRVAMQFGIDQDIPGNGWYNPISLHTNLYIPSRLCKPGVTLRYSKWWRKSMGVHDNGIEGVMRKKRSLRDRPAKCVWALSKVIEDTDGSRSSCYIVKHEDSVYRRKPEVDETLSSGGEGDVVKAIKRVDEAKFGLDNSEDHGEKLATGHRLGQIDVKELAKHYVEDAMGDVEVLAKLYAEDSMGVDVEELAKYYVEDSIDKQAKALKIQEENLATGHDLGHIHFKEVYEMLSSDDEGDVVKATKTVEEAKFGLDDSVMVSTSAVLKKRKNLLDVGPTQKANETPKKAKFGVTKAVVPLYKIMELAPGGPVVPTSRNQDLLGKVEDLKKEVKAGTLRIRDLESSAKTLEEEKVGFLERIKALERDLKTAQDTRAIAELRVKTLKGELEASLEQVTLTMVANEVSCLSTATHLQDATALLKHQTAIIQGCKSGAELLDDLLNVEPPSGPVETFSFEERAHVHVQAIEHSVLKGFREGFLRCRFQVERAHPEVDLASLDIGAALDEPSDEELKAWAASSKKLGAAGSSIFEDLDSKPVLNYCNNL